MGKQLITWLWLMSWIMFAGPSASAISDRVTDWLGEEVKFGVGGMRLGPFDIRTRLSGTALYDDNIYIHTRTNQSDLIWVVAPGISAGAGNYLVGGDKFLKLDYSPSFLFFVAQDQNNSIDHDGSLLAQLQIAKLSIGLQQQVQVSSGSLLEVGNRVNRRIYSTGLSLKYPLGAKTSLEVSGRQTINDYERLIGSREWANANFINYQLTPKVNTGVGVTFGYRELQRNPHQTYEQFLLRAGYGFTGKTELHGTFGGELAQYGGGGSSGFSPVFSLGAGYRPFDPTSVSLEAYRRDQNSVAFAGQNYTTTGFNASLRQRFLHRTFFTLGGGYENLSYHSTQTGVTANREDNYFFVRFNWEWNITPRWLVGLFFLHRDNDSNAQPFANNQVGLQSAFTF